LVCVKAAGLRTLCRRATGSPWTLRSTQRLWCVREAWPRPALPRRKSGSVGLRFFALTLRGPCAVGRAPCRGVGRVRRAAPAGACSQGGQLAVFRGGRSRRGKCGGGATAFAPPGFEARLHPSPRAVPSRRLRRGSGCRRTRILLSLCVPATLRVLSLWCKAALTHAAQSASAQCTYAPRRS